MTGTRLRDIIAAILILCLALLIVFVLIPKGVQVPGTVKTAALSPAFWPRIIGYAAIISAIFLVVETLSIHPPQADKSDEETAEAKLAHSALRGNIKVAILIVALFVFYFSLTTLGIVVGSIILMAAMMLFFGEKHYLLIAVLSISIPLLLFVFFRHVASVPIPLGIFGG